MDLLHPILMDFDKKVIVESLFDVDLTEHRFAVTMKKSISVIFISKDRMEKLNEWVSLTSNSIPPTKDKMDDYLAIQMLIRICAENAEDINRRLLKINLDYMDVPLHDREKIFKFDFMKLKDNFIEYIKQDSLIKTVDEYSSNQKMKTFRRNLDNFIIIRNIYTHGYLHMLDPSYNFIIEYVHNITKQKTYASISIEILISYNKFYTEIIRLFNTFIMLKQQQGENKQPNARLSANFFVDSPSSPKNIPK